MISVHYTPPGIDALALVRAAAEEAAESAGQLILDASQELVPVDTGALKASGRLVHEDGAQVAIVYGQEDGAGRDGQDTAAYAVPQHERLDFQHATGQAKYLETALHGSSERVADTVVTVVRRVLQ